MDGEAGVITRGSVGIRDEFIEFVTSDMDRIPADFIPDRIIDGKHRLAMPGLVNGHAHTAMTIFRNYAADLSLQDWLFGKIIPAEAKLLPEDEYWGTLHGIAEMIRTGTTSFADMYIHMDEVVRAVDETGIRANIAKGPITSDRERGGLKVDRASCSDYFKTWHNKNNGLIKVYIEIHSTYLYSEQTIRDAAALAKELGTGIHIHILETKAEKNISIEKYGMNTPEVCLDFGIFDVPVLAAHCVHLTDDDLKLFKSKGVHVVHNPTSNLKLGSGIARIPAMLERGINVCLGTDGAASNNNLNLFEEMNLASLLHKGVHHDATLVNARQALRMATVNGSEALGFGGETGILKKGMKADLILLDTDKSHYYPMNDPVSAIVYTGQGSDVDTVIVNGKILMENRELKTIDEERVKHQVVRISDRILRDS